MEKYNIYLTTEAEKYRVIALIRSTGATVTGVSGCGSGYYIQLQATRAQALEINNRLGVNA